MVDVISNNPTPPAAPQAVSQAAQIAALYNYLSAASGGLTKEQQAAFFQGIVDAITSTNPHLLAHNAMPDPPIPSSAFTNALNLLGVATTINVDTGTATTPDHNILKKIVGNTLTLVLADNIIVKTIKAMLINNPIAWPATPVVLGLGGGDVGTPGTINSQPPATDGNPFFQFLMTTGTITDAGTGTTIATITLPTGFLTSYSSVRGRATFTDSVTGIQYGRAVSKVDAQTIKIVKGSAAGAANLANTIQYNVAVNWYPVT